MALRSKFNTDTFDFNSLAEKTWECPVKGLRKTLLSFKFESMKKATEISKCFVEISDVRNLGERESNYLRDTVNQDFWIQLGSALTPIDCYVEIFLQKMFVGETSQCTIKTKSSDVVQFTIRLKQIEFVNYLFRLTPKEMYDLALKYKENGVVMFKMYPLFAQAYFSRAAKCLISFKPFDGLTEKADGVNPMQMRELLQTVQLNIAACLIKEKRFEDVLFLTKFVDDGGSDVEVSDKAIYRRTVAFCYLKKYEEAKATLEKCDYRANKEFSNLYNKILTDWKLERNKYNDIVKKMFGK